MEITPGAATPDDGQFSVTARIAYQGLKPAWTYVSSLAAGRNADGDPAMAWAQSVPLRSPHRRRPPPPEPAVTGAMKRACARAAFRAAAGAPYRPPPAGTTPSAMSGTALTILYPAAALG